MLPWDYNIILPEIFNYKTIGNKQMHTKVLSVHPNIFINHYYYITCNSRVYNNKTK